jgi:SAM-dependent methyltransferase
VASEASARSLALPPNRIEPETQLQLWFRNVTAASLLRILAEKLRRRVSDRAPEVVPCTAYNGLVVFDNPEVDGGGMVCTADLVAELFQLGISRCKRVLEFCAGPGYLGYFLLAHGFCETLVLSDISPSAIAAARHTARYNQCEHLVTSYISDCLRDVPSSERFDLVVINPPAHLPPASPSATNVVDHDPAWRVHREFYGEVGAYLSAGAYVIAIEDSASSAPK